MFANFKRRVLLMLTVGVAFATPVAASAADASFGRPAVQDRQAGEMRMSDFDSGRGFQCDSRDRKSKLDLNSGDSRPRGTTQAVSGTAS